MSEPLFMVRAALNAKALFGRLERRGIPARQTNDVGYHVHCVLQNLFGEEEAPKPFRVMPMDGQRFITVLGYTTAPADKLKALASTFADPEIYAFCDWETFSTRPMLTQFESGTRLGFEVQMCPTRRINAEQVDEKTGRAFKKMVEVDAFLSQYRKVNHANLSMGEFLARKVQPGDAVGAIAMDRKRIYEDFLMEKLTEDGGAKLERVAVTQMESTELYRRTQATPGQGRRARPIQRPSVTFEGLLTVTDGERFQALLARGIGRHRTFGFGMLILKPPSRIAA